MIIESTVTGRMRQNGMVWHSNVAVLCRLLSTAQLLLKHKMNIIPTEIKPLSTEVRLIWDCSVFCYGGWRSLCFRLCRLLIPILNLFHYIRDLSVFRSRQPPSPSGVWVTTAPRPLHPPIYFVRVGTWLQHRSVHVKLRLQK